MRAWELNEFDYPLDAHDTWWGNRQYKEQGGRMVLMSPDEYIRKVRPLTLDDESNENIEDFIDNIKSGKKLDPLVIYPDGKEDGRHRAYAAKILGIKKVPVIIWDNNLNEGFRVDPVTIDVTIDFDPETVTTDEFNNMLRDISDHKNRGMMSWKVNGKEVEDGLKAAEEMKHLIQYRVDASKKEKEKWAKRQWDAKGQPYAKSAELVPVWWLKRLQGNTLRGDTNIGYNPDNDDWDRGSLEDLAKSLKVRGIQEPIMISVGWQDGYAFIGEGNHRIEAAEMAGISKLPARVWMKKEASHKYDSGSIRHEVLDDLTFDIGDYKAQYLTRPSKVFKSLAGDKK